MAQTRSKSQARSKSQTRSKAQPKNERRTFYNTITDFEVSHVHEFEDSFGETGYYFTLDLGFITIYSMQALMNKDGDYYITFPSRKGKDGEWYKTGYIENSALTDSIVEAILQS